MGALMSGLSLQAISKRFGSSTAVDQVNLSVPQGTFVCLLGPSGCGKTTLLRMIAGLEDPSEGAILLDGADITALPTHRRDFGMVFQSLALFPHLEVGDNIAYPLRIRGVARADQRKRVEELLALVRLAGLADRSVTQLSGGQRQRVAIARALFTNPRILILDEATSALDYESEAIIQRNMAAICQGRSVIIIAHRLSAVRQANRIVAMDKGRIVEAGSHAELVDRPQGLYAYLWRMQHGPAPVRQGPQPTPTSQTTKPSPTPGSAAAGDQA